MMQLTVTGSVLGFKEKCVYLLTHAHLMKKNGDVSLWEVWDPAFFFLKEGTSPGNKRQDIISPPAASGAYLPFFSLPDSLQYTLKLPAMSVRKHSHNHQHPPSYILTIMSTPYQFYTCLLLNPAANWVSHTISGGILHILEKCHLHIKHNFLLLTETF